VPSLRSGDQASTGIESISPRRMCAPLKLSAFVRSRRELFCWSVARTGPSNRLGLGFLPPGQPPPNLRPGTGMIIFNDRNQ